MDNEVGHLFIVDIEFNFENADPIMMYNKICPPIIDKHKKLDPNERSVFQLCELYSENDDYIPQFYRNTEKPQVTLFRFI